jgi:hypothetical protein
MARLLKQAVLASANHWWCSWRWWADRVHLHPVIGTALQSFKAFRWNLAQSPMLEACMKAHARKLQLIVVSLNGGLWVRPQAGADWRIGQAAREANAICRDQRPRVVAAQPTAFRADTAVGLHAVRVCARAVALSTVNAKRLDAEGVERVDIEAQSAKAWSSWVKGLTPQERKFLAIWRAGAIWTPTRRWFRPGASPLQTCCLFCGAEAASARHLWTVCAHFAAARRGLEREFQIEPRWWLAQPRVTAKSGWVTLEAGGDTRRRAQLQVVACRLGILIARQMELV